MSDTQHHRKMYETLFSEKTQHRSRTTNPTNPADYRPGIWKLGNHGRAVDIDLDEMTQKLEQQSDLLDDDARHLLDAARRVRDRASLYDFECPNDECRISHGHDDSKHDIREKFSVTEEFTAEMAMTPFCHCGVSELSMLMEFYHDIRMPVFEDQSDLTPSERDARIEAIRRAADSAPLHDDTLRYIESLRDEVAEARDRVYEQESGFVYGEADATMPEDTDDSEVEDETTDDDDDDRGDGGGLRDLFRR